MSDRPQDFGIGLAKGSASLIKHTVFGVTDTISKFTASIGKGISLTTLDNKYLVERRRRQGTNRPKHALSGVAQGATSFVSSVASGITGMVEKPIEGAKTKGVAGFFEGIGRGLVGVVTKPMLGVFDLATNVSEGIRNTTTVFDGTDVERMRLPRVTPMNGILQVGCATACAHARPHACARAGVLWGRGPWPALAEAV